MASGLAAESSTSGRSSSPGPGACRPQLIHPCSTAPTHRLSGGRLRFETVAGPDRDVKASEDYWVYRRWRTPGDARRREQQLVVAALLRLSEPVSRNQLCAAAPSVPHRILEPRLR